MKNSRKMKKWGCVMLALMSGLMLPGIVQANSGLSDTPQIIDEENYYVGIKGASGNEVVIDNDLDAGAVGGYAESDSGDAEASNNRVTVNDGGVVSYISGGYAYTESGDVYAGNNRVTVNGGTVKDSGSGDIYISGGYAYTESGDAYAGDNRVTVNGGKVAGDIYGGDAYSVFNATASNNRVTVNDGGIVEGYIYGGLGVSYWTGDTYAKNNSVTVSGGTVENCIYGGYANARSYGGGNATAENNSVTISGGTVKDTIYGGYADFYDDSEANSGSVKAKRNRVTVSGGTVESGIYGGLADSYVRGNAAAENNSVTISGGTVKGNIDGGTAYSDFGNTTANNNSVSVNGGMVEGTIYGGCAESDSGDACAESNSVTIGGGTVERSIYGGRAYSSSGSTYAESNSVTMSGGTVGGSAYGSGDIYGGYARSFEGGNATAENNSVTVSGGTVKGNIDGGAAYSDSGSATASNNSAAVSGGTVENCIYGGYARSSEGGNATAENNSVTISGGTVKDTIYGGDAYSDSGNATASSNKAEVSGGTVDGYIYGGFARSLFQDAYAENNNVTVSGGTVGGSVYGSSYIYGGSAQSYGDSYVTNNSVTVSGGMVEGWIEGGHAESFDDGDAAATNNRVTVSGGTVEGTVYSGRAYSKFGDAYANNNRVTVGGGTVGGSAYGGYAESESGDATANSNSVTVSGGTVKGDVYGGYAVSSGSAGAKDNTVILSGTADISNANLYGRNSEAEGTNNNLVINGWSGAVKSLNNFDQIQVKALAGGLDLAAGKRTVFVNTAEGIHGGSLNPTEAKEMQAGVALTVDGTIEKDGNTLLIDTSSVRASDQTVIATESRAASVAAVGRGAEAVTDSLDTLRGSGEGLSTFASIIGSRSRYNTGSHADVNGWNGIVGTAWTRELTSGTLSYGAFYENGGGSYDTHNTINGRTYRGDGDTVYNGGGLLLRWETNGGTYTEASLRAGMVKNEVGPSLEFAGNRYGFKTENNYYGGHVGIGRIMERDDGDAWDIYGKYFHMHHEGDTVIIAGDEFAFDSVNSDRLRVGARYLDRKNDRFTGYYGLAYEYEFSGDTGGTANHHAMYTPSLQGSTVIGEIGFRGTPREDSPWSFEVSLRGYAGKQEGISGAVTAAYSF